MLAIAAVKRRGCSRSIYLAIAAPGRILEGGVQQGSIVAAARRAVCCGSVFGLTPRELREVSALYAKPWLPASPAYRSPQ